jgi:hypothetical protein
VRRTDWPTFPWNPLIGGGHLSFSITKAHSNLSDLNDFPQRHCRLALRHNTSLLCCAVQLWRVLMGLLGSKGGPCMTRVVPGGCPGLGSCRAAECVWPWSPQPAAVVVSCMCSRGPCCVHHPITNPCHPHSDSDPFCAAPPNPCPASVLVCLAQITSAVAVQLLCAAGNCDETLASRAR